MTDQEKLARAKAIIGITDTAQDTLLNDYIKEAGYFILAITAQAVLPLILEGAQIDIAVSAYTKRGAEGEGSHSEGGVSVSYDLLSPALLALLRSQTLARVVDMTYEST